MSSKRDEYVQRLQAALDGLKVKASLAKLEARDVRDDLRERYDTLRDRLRRLREASEDRWEGLRQGTESAWREFRRVYDEATHKTQPR
jgi:hypothetical protein